jgi:hypothetical protein
LRRCPVSWLRRLKLTDADDSDVAYSLTGTETRPKLIDAVEMGRGAMSDMIPRNFNDRNG